jgi:hypothetical protein
MYDWIELVCTLHFRNIWRKIFFFISAIYFITFPQFTWKVTARTQPHGTENTKCLYSCKIFKSVPQSICDQAGFAFIMSQTILTQLDCNLNLKMEKLRISNLLCRIAIFVCAKSYLSAEMQGTAARITHEVGDTYMLQI